MTFVCGGCVEGIHEGCRGETWCDCQHRDTQLARLPHKTWSWNNNKTGTRGRADRS